MKDVSAKTRRLKLKTSVNVKNHVNVSKRSKNFSKRNLIARMPNIIVIEKKLFLEPKNGRLEAEDIDHLLVSLKEGHLLVAILTPILLLLVGQGLLQPGEELAVLEPMLLSQSVVLRLWMLCSKRLKATINLRLLFLKVALRVSERH